MARLSRITTDRPHSAIRYALIGWFSDPANHLLPNREAARALRVDESTVRDFRSREGIPALAVGSGKPVDEEPKKPNRTRRKRR